MKSPIGPSDDDAFWQRPAPGSAQSQPEHSPTADSTPTSTPRSTPTYDGPPRTSQPPPYWRPPTIAQPSAPRALPPQDIDALDEAESSARTVTYGVGLLAAAIALILLCLLCGRTIL